MDGGSLLRGLLINVASSLVSLPLVFVFYDLYKSALSFKSTKLVNEVIEKNINNIFLKFTFFTTHFYNEFSSENKINAYDLDDELKKNEEDIFKNISSNIHHGYFIFSIFDDFSRDINDVLNSNSNIRWINLQELSVLQQFINDYMKLKRCFSWITKDDFIKYVELKNITIKESGFASSTNEDEIYYDIKLMIKPDKTVTYYSSKFSLYEDHVLATGYKLSGNKAKEISKVLFQLYQSINRWKKIRNIDKLKFDTCFVSANRLYVDDNITFNEHMENNFSFHGQF
ncbi:hypothetical protein [Paenibacillus amylolyticus]|uniref:hypothetical protein n=1 Tax=Paenibacillus amylolyticus TaxID=1451 RepID=UPI003EC06C5A